MVDRRHTGTIICSGCRRNGTVVIGFIPQAYQHGVLSIRVAGILVRELVWVQEQCTGTKEQVVVIFLGLGRVRQGPISVLAKTLF